MPDAHANFAYSTVATAPSPASSGLSLVVAAGDGAKFPAVPFNATVWPASTQPLTTNAEIVRVTGRATDTLTIVRAQESSSARSIIVGDQIAATITAKTLTDVETPITGKAGSFTFTLTDNYQRFTVTDAAVTTASKIIGTITRPTIAEVDDTGWHYTFNVVTLAAGSFDITVFASQWGEDADKELVENPVVFTSELTPIESGTYMDWRGPTGANEAAAQSFVAVATGYVSRLLLAMVRHGTVTDSAYVSLYTNVAGKPGVKIGTSSALLDLTKVPTSGDPDTETRLVEMFFISGDAVVTAGTTYWLVFERTAANDAANTPGVWMSHEAYSLGYTNRTSGVWGSVDANYHIRFAFETIKTTKSSEVLTLNYLIPA